MREFGDNVCLITLTKYKYFSTDNKSVSITWNEIINVFQNHAKNKKDDSLENVLLTDYFNFLTNIKNSMKFYEKEVFSVPAGGSHHLVKASHVYERPADYKSFQKPLYLAFRKRGGGEMECLYSIDEIIKLNFARDYDDFLKSEYSKDIKTKVKKYVELIKWEKFPEDDKQVFVLSDKVIKFQEPFPRPEKNQAFTAYYDLADMFDADKETGIINKRRSQ